MVPGNHEAQHEPAKMIVGFAIDLSAKYTPAALLGFIEKFVISNTHMCLGQKGSGT